MKFEVVRIKELGKVITGTTPPTKEQKYYDGEYLLIKPSDIIAGQKIVNQTEDVLSDEIFKDFKRFILPLEATCVVTIGSIGKQCFTDQICMTNQQINSIIPNDNFDNKFVYYLLEYNNPKVKSMSSGSASGRENVNKSSFESIKVKVPKSIEVQKRIASILTTYDDLIENNQKRIAILEQMVQQIYKEWFVRFRFPGHKELEIADGLPKGWNRQKLGSIVGIQKGKNITKKTRKKGDIPVVAGGIYPAYYHNESNTSAPVVTISASGANAGFIKLYFKEVWASDCSYIDRKSSPYIFYIYLTLAFRQKEVFYLQRGSAQPHVYPKDLMNLKIIHPNTELINKFENFINPFFKKIEVLKLENKNLIQSRDLLLPRLLSGKLKV